MISPRLCCRLKTTWLSAALRSHPRSFASNSSASDDGEGSELKKETPKTAAVAQPSKEAARDIANDKLNKLLQSIIKDEFTLNSKPVEVPTAKSKKGAFKKSKDVKTHEIGKEMAEAIEEVAKAAKGDRHSLQAELVEKVASMQKSGVEHFIDDSIPKEETGPPREPINLSDLIAEMKIDKTKPKPASDHHLRSSHVREHLSKRSDREGFVPKIRSRPDQRPYVKRDPEARVGLFSGEPLGIFKKVVDLPPAEPLLTTWEKLEQRELRLAITRPPANIYEEMALLTKQGKLWKFPINNEQGMEAEEQVHFSEHIFLDKHLKGWCPNKGPVRHFMELVCIGLSKNPYFTVEEKKAHIQGYREYFESKKVVLKELGAM